MRADVVIPRLELPELRSIHKGNPRAIVGSREVALALPVESQKRGAFEFELPSFGVRDILRAVTEDRRASSEDDVPERPVIFVVRDDALQTRFFTPRKVRRIHEPDGQDLRFPSIGGGVRFDPSFVEGVAVLDVRLDGESENIDRLMFLWPRAESRRRAVPFGEAFRVCIVDRGVMSVEPRVGTEFRRRRRGVVAVVVTVGNERVRGIEIGNIVFRRRVGGGILLIDCFRRIENVRRVVTVAERRRGNRG